MSKIFLNIVNMSISAGYIVLAVLLLRLILKKAPKWISVILWGIVALRLVLPFSIESVFSLIPSAETISPEIMTDKSPTIHTGIPLLNSTLNPIISDSFSPTAGDSANPLQLIVPVLAVIWVIGIAALLIYTAFSYWSIRRKLQTAVLLRARIYQSENVTSPFVFGLIKPKIYLPFNMNDNEMNHVIAHEQAHISRKDHLWKPLGFLLLTLHWFNPLLWLGYSLLCRDIELACDEKVIKKLDCNARADYSEALLTCSINRRAISACPLAFGEVGVKKRIKSVLNYKKPAFWLIIVAVVACVAVAVCFLTNPPQKQDDKSMSPHGDIYTDYEGVYITIKSIDKDEGGQNIFNIVWHNETDKEITYGEMYTVEYKVGEEWLEIDFDEERFFTTIGYALKKNKTESKSYIAEHYDLSENGTYRFIVPFSVKEGDKYVSYRTWAEFKVGPLLNVDSLREQYPEYFDIDVSNGLDIYVWQMAQGIYSFGLLSHSEQPREWISNELLNLRGTKADELRTILATYNVDDKEIYIIPWQNPISSYIGDWQIVSDGENLDTKRQEYVEYIRQMLFGTWMSNGEEQSKCTLIYASPIYSFTMSPSAVPTVVIENETIYTITDGSKERLGTVGKTTVDQFNFDAYIKEYGGFDHSELAKELRTNNKAAYEVNPDSSANGIEIYYIMEQKTGETLIVYGHYENGEKENEIRFIYSISQ